MAEFNMKLEMDEFLIQMLAQAMIDSMEAETLITRLESKVAALEGSVKENAQCALGWIRIANNEKRIRESLERENGILLRRCSNQKEAIENLETYLKEFSDRESD